MAEARAGSPSPAVAAMVALARRIDGGDPLHDEPAVVFRPLAPDERPPDEPEAD